MVRKWKRRQPNEVWRWSHKVAETSDALDLEKGVFTWHSPRRIAQSLRYSALASRRRKGTAYQSAVSMLNFYINRAGKRLPERQRLILQQAKIELRLLFGKEGPHVRST